MPRMSEALLIGGCAGVGKTSVAAELHEQLSRAQIRHAVVEGDFLDLAWPAPHEQGLRLAEANLATIWQRYREAGYDRLVYTNTVSVRSDVLKDLSVALGTDTIVRGVLLTASPGAIVDRLVGREIGTGLSDHLERSAAAAADLAGRAPSWVDRIDTTGRAVEQIAFQIPTRLDWL